MNLQEDIDRIKEVMGLPDKVEINEASMNPYLLRRIPEFIRAVEDVADAIYVRSDRDFSESDFRNFLDRAIFGSIRDVIEHYDLTHEELGKLEIILSRIIYGDKDLLQKIKQIYISKLDLESDGINESTSYLKRRLPEVIEGVLQAAEWYNPRMMPDFDVFLDRAIYSGIVSVIPDSYADSNVKEMHDLEEVLRDTIYGDKQLLKKMKSIYYKNDRIDESTVDKSIKRRIPEILKSVVDIAEILHVPRWYDSFLGFMENAVFHAIRNAKEGEIDQETFDRVQYYLMGIIERDEKLYKKLRDIFDRKISRL